VNALRAPTQRPSKPRFARRPADRATIDQYLLLSMLVHVFVIVSFGDTSGGMSRTFGRVGGMTVALRGTSSAAPAEVAAGGLKMDGGRFLPAPGAAAPPTPTPASRTAADRPAPTPVPTATSPPADAVSQEAPPVLARPVEKPVTDFVVPTPTPAREAVTPADQGVHPVLVVPPKIDLLAPMKPDGGFAAFVEAPRVPDPVQPAPLPAPLAPITPASIDSRFAPPVVLAPPTLPTLSKLPSITAPAPATELTPYRAPTLSNLPVVTPAPLDALTAPRINQSFSSAPEAKSMVEPVVTPAPLAPLPPVRLDSEFASPVEVKRADIIVAPPAPLTPLPPASVGRELTPYIEQRARELPGTVSDAVSPAAESAKPGVADPLGNPAAAAPATGPAGGGRDAILPGPDRANTNAPEGRTPPRINLDSIKDRAREIAREGTGPRTLFPSLTAPKPPKNSTQEAFDKALKRPDCKDVYAEMGLAAVIPLVRDAVTEKGCKW
jgi:Meckel syndrome type 1 protein